MMNGDTDRKPGRKLPHTPLVQSENQSGEWSEVHGKRRFT